MKTGLDTSKYYNTTTNTYIATHGNTWKGECTTYAWGRACENSKGGNLPDASAGKWFASKHGYSTGQVAKANSIGCFGSHVTYIESVTGTNLTFSEANWYTGSDLSNGKWKGTDGDIKSMSIDNFKLRSGGTFQGFIYLS